MLYLASRSPRRRALLARLGLEFGVLDLDVPECRASGEPPEDYVRRVAREKAGAGLLQVVSVSDVRFEALDDSVIAAYVASGEPMGKAGGYAIQGGGERFVSHLSGSYSGVMGLPLHQTAKLLQAFGMAMPFDASSPRAASANEGAGTGVGHDRATVASVDDVSVDGAFVDVASIDDAGK